MRHVQDMPASIVVAIAKIQQAMKSVEKDGNNTHGGYKFASTDAVYAALSAKMGEVGLTIITLEDPPEFKVVEGPKGPQRWCQFTFRFVLATEDGTWTDERCCRTLHMQILGPQSYMAAQSYCEKAFLRSLFKIPTGDLDLDQLPAGEEEKPKKRKSSASAKREGLWEAFIEEIDPVETFDQVLELEMRFKEEFKDMNDYWRGLFYDRIESKRDEIQKSFI